LLYVLQFVVGIYTNMKALQHSNIDTVIVFRASCPLAVCVLEWAFLGRQLPNCRSCMALLCILLGVLGYVSADKSFVVGGIHAYTWVIAYTLVTATQMAYGKYIVGPDMKFASMWRPRPPTAPPPALRAPARPPHRRPRTAPPPRTSPLTPPRAARLAPSKPKPEQVGADPVHERAEHRAHAGHRDAQPRAGQAGQAERARARAVDAAHHRLPARLVRRRPRHLLHRLVLPLTGDRHG